MLRLSKNFKKSLNTEYADAKTSPLTAEDLAIFKTLDFYPINEKFFVTAKFVRTEKRKTFRNEDFNYKKTNVRKIR